MNSFATPAAQRVDMERRDSVRNALQILTAENEIPREEVRAHVVALLLESCAKQSRWTYRPKSEAVA